MKTAHKLLMLIAVVMTLAACTTLRTSSDYDKKIDFTGYKTYNFYDKGIARVKLNNLDKRRMLSAIEAEMNAKGFTKADKPDLLVNLVVVARERVDVYNYGPGYYGWGGWGWGWRSPFWGPSMNSVDQYMEGTIIIDFLDPKQKILIWHGRGSGFNLDNMSKREERVQSGVKEILAQYPPK
jgi:opacity protein-like surface antigen